MTIRNREILTLPQLAKIYDAYEQGKTLVDLANSHSVSIAVLKSRLRYYLGTEKLRTVMPTVHPKALAARNKAAKEGRLKQYHAAVAKIPLPGIKSKHGKPKPYYAEWLQKTKYGQ